MEYKIEIWMYRNLAEEYESDNIESILEWYKTYWKHCYDCGGCALDVYKNGELLDFDEKYELGFYD